MTPFLLSLYQVVHWLMIGPRVFEMMQKEVLHELEIEFSDMPLLMHEGEKAFRGEESIYYDLVQVFLNNIRM